MTRGARSAPQVISHNLLYGHNSYFSSGWNVMDGILVLISVVDLCMSLMSTGSPKIFNILRVGTSGSKAEMRGFGLGDSFV